MRLLSCLSLLLKLNVLAAQAANEAGYNHPDGCMNNAQHTQQHQLTKHLAKGFVGTRLEILPAAWGHDLLAQQCSVTAPACHLACAGGS